MTKPSVLTLALILLPATANGTGPWLSVGKVPFSPSISEMAASFGTIR